MLLVTASLEPGIFGIIRPVLVWSEGICDGLKDGAIWRVILAHELFTCAVRQLAPRSHVVEAISGSIAPAWASWWSGGAE